MNFTPLIFAVIAIVIGSLTGQFEIGLLLGLLVGLTKLQWDTEQNFKRLRTQIRHLSERLAAKQFEKTDSASGAEASVATHTATNARWSNTTEINDTPQRIAQVSYAKTDKRTTKNTPPPANPLTAFFTHMRAVVWRYFTDGNVFVRVGLLILFFGVAFLLKYAAENSKIPLELRFLGAAAGGVALLFVGWSLRSRNTLYGLLLQGGGIGIIYITIFASYRIAHLIPAMLTFTLLVVFALFTAALAVLQNSRALAIYAVLGGFLAPFLASSGSGNYIGLFSFYAALNIAVFIIAWFKSWRPLNLIGFTFSFGAYALWFATSYRVAMLMPAMSFLLLFFLMYSIIGVLYALKQKHDLKGLVDGTLVFGTPLIASSLLMGLLRHLDYGIAFAAAGMGVYYVMLVRFLWRRNGEQLRVLSEAMLAIAVVFATLAIPYSLDGHWTSATWALESAGILWVSIRQQRRYAQWFAIVLQIGAGLVFLLRNAGDTGTSVWINPAFLGGVFIALGAFASARLLYRMEADSRLRPLHNFFFVWAMGWWLTSAIIQIDHYLEYQISAALIVFILTAGALVYLERIRNWNWAPAQVALALLLPILILISFLSLLDYGHVLILPDTLCWIMALTLNYRVIVLLETAVWPAALKYGLHIAFVLFLACLFSLDLYWYFDNWMPAIGEGFVAVLTLIPLVFIYAARTARFPAIARFGAALQFGIIGTLSLLIALWSIAVNIANTGNPAPLPYLPFINPIDLAHIAFFISLAQVLNARPLPWPKAIKPASLLIGSLIFVWISTVLLRSMHHYLAIPFVWSELFTEAKVQTALSILWAVIGMLAMLFASRRQLRPLWIAGAVLVALVLVKMFFIDLGAIGTVERIVSFLVVGALLVAMGYFSPLPLKVAESDRNTGVTHHA